MSQNKAETNNQLVTVLIPIYKTGMSDLDNIALDRCFGLWGGKFDIFFVTPQSLDISDFKKQYPLSKFASFDDKYFGSLRAYNCLMLSTEFYEKFLDYKYIFIYQTDGYAFRDELEQWCNRGYDYVGAPWIPREGSKGLLNVIFVHIRKAFNKMQGKPDRSFQYYQVGNGGVSLRRTQLFRDITIKDKANIDSYISKLGTSSLYNEDIYWSLAPKKGEVLQLYKPDYKEALEFSFDMNPAVCHKLNNFQLPFCCHSFSKPKFWKFWKNHIPI